MVQRSKFLPQMKKQIVSISTVSTVVQEGYPASKSSDPKQVLQEKRIGNWLSEKRPLSEEVVGTGTVFKDLSSV